MARNCLPAASARLTATCCRADARASSRPWPAHGGRLRNYRRVRPSIRPAGAAGGSRWPVWRLRGSGPCRLCELEGSRVGVDSPRSRLVDRLPLLVLRPGHIPRRLPHSALSGGGDDNSKHSRTLPSPLRIVAARQDSSLSRLNFTRNAHLPVSPRPRAPESFASPPPANFPVSQCVRGL